MKRYSTLFKFLAFVLSALCLLTTLFCGYGIISLFSANLYQDYPLSVAQGWCYPTGQKKAESAATYYAATELGNCPRELVEVIYDGLGYYGGSQVSVKKDGKVVYSVGNVINDGITMEYKLNINCPVVITDEDNDQPDNLPPEKDDSIYENIAESGSTLDPIIHTYDVPISGGEAITYKVRYKEVTLEAVVTLDQSVLKNTNYQLLSGLFPYRYTLIWGLVIAFLLGLSMLVYLLWVAGRNMEGIVSPAGLSKLPLDLYLLAVVGFMYFLRQLFYEIVDTIYAFHALIFNLVGIALGVPLLIGFLYIWAAQVKYPKGYWLRHTLIGHFLLLCLKGGHALLRMLPTIWQWLLVSLITAGVSSISFILGFGSGEPIFRLLFLVCFVGCIGLICYSGYCFGLLLIGSRKMAQGHLDYQIPEKHLFGGFRDYAQQLNSLSVAANEAMQSKIRSERMKTELITNVSHDIKTPLTSIINFVDLLEKPHTPEDEAQYLDILSRQSQRLKKLIEDLMELSKASTGNMTVTLITLDAVEAVNQALGEFSDKLENASLTPVIRGPEDALPILADGRLLWRVLSNLLSNVVKYAAPNTRVYIDVAEINERVHLSIRNISSAELNISADELLERFVRGDVSRNTEGSGLGLNIAKSLMEVQGGAMELSLDGDLFKVTLVFPKA